jgi:hypothetical protein
VLAFASVARTTGIPRYPVGGACTARIEVPAGGACTARIEGTCKAAHDWHESLGDPTIADAICDRLVHNAHMLTLRGTSMRRQKGLKPQPDPNPPPDQASYSSLRSES